MRFSKEGTAIYISHLDLMRLMQRAFLRAGLPLQHTEGFNPHARISVALPLSVGMESVCEFLDFTLLDEAQLADTPRRLNGVLPMGVRVLRAYEAVRKTKEIAALRIKGVLEYDRGADPGLAEALAAFFGAGQIVIEKKTKKGIQEADIRPGIQKLELARRGGNEVELQAEISAQNPGLNPMLLIQALKETAPHLAPDFACFRRLEALDAAGQTFV